MLQDSQSRQALLDVPAEEPQRDCPGWTPPPADYITEEDRLRRVSLHSGKAYRQTQRIHEAQKIAQAILQARHMKIIQDESGAYMVDTLTGELVEAGPGLARPERFAALLLLGAQLENHFTGLVFPAEDAPEEPPFETGGAIFTPSLRMDPNGMEGLRRRSRKRAVESVTRATKTLTNAERAACLKNWRGRRNWCREWFFLTLTMPHIEAAKNLPEIHRINRAFTLFRKTVPFELKVEGGIKSIEDKATSFGPHVHLHALLLMKYWEQADLKETWRRCLDKATRELTGQGLEADAPLIVDIRMVKPKGRTEGNSIALDDAISECVKYVTKPDDYAALSADTLMELLEVSRWPRMFELLGACRAPRMVKTAPHAPDDGLDADALLDREAVQGSVHTACISGDEQTGTQGQLFPAWADTLEMTTTPPTAPVDFGSDPDPPKTRPPTWRQLMDILPFDLWLTRIVERAKCARHFRARQLAAFYPNAALFTLTGVSLGAL